VTSRRTALRAAVYGHPIAHSLSPVLHRAAYAALGLDDWTYDAYDVTVAQLPEAMARLDAGWAGLSLTMPLKAAVLDMVDHVEPLARVVGGANTVIVDAQGRPAVAANTDVYGIVEAFREVGVVTARTAAVLGGGATASAALAALAQLGATTPVVYVRSVARAAALLPAAHRMGVEITLRPLHEAPEGLTKADLVVSTVPEDGADAVAAELGPVSGVLLDVRYDVRPTPLLHAWQRSGGVGITGERMLLHQACEQVRLMTGHDAPFAAMDAALAGALSPA
jgi:shikimate dehydrogenase